MTLEERINKDMVEAMKAKDQARLRGLRAIKAAIQLAKTEAKGKAVDEAREMQILQKLVKQRRDSLEIFEKENREDLAQKEREEIAVIETYLPKPMSPEELEAAVKAIIEETGASSMKDMGKVMGLATKKLAGKADGKAISTLVRQLLG
ncbi:MAG: GatB/YqeY domain-containing protein [Saprospiraceae bacterium]